MRSLSEMVSLLLSSVYSASAAPDSEVAQVRQLVEAGQITNALTALGRIKEHGVPTKGADCLRAACFLQQGRVGEAVEALREESRHFLPNKATVALLEDLSANQPAF